MSTCSDSICENTCETSHVHVIHDNFSVLITALLDQIQQNLLRKETYQTCWHRFSDVIWRKPNSTLNKIWNCDHKRTSVSSPNLKGPYNCSQTAKNGNLILFAFITGNSSLEPLNEGLCAQIHVNLRWRVFGRNRTGDLTDYYISWVPRSPPLSYGDGWITENPVGPSFIIIPRRQRGTWEGVHMSTCTMSESVEREEG